MLLSARGHSFFHTAEWARVLSGAYSYTPLYFSVLDNGRLLALIPVMEINSVFTAKRGISLPFSDYCEPIIAERGLFSVVFNRMIRYGKKAGWKVVELRGGRGMLQGVASSYFFSHTLDLTRDEEGIFSKFRSNTKRNIKKAMKEGVCVEICNSPESIKQFYRLNCLTRKEHGLPPQPYSFFRKLHEEVISRDMGFVALASYKGQKIAGAVYFRFGDTAMYKYGASDRRFQHLRANNMVMWESIKWHAEKGYRRFCFGRTEPENKGLRVFKSGWGGEEKVICYYKYDLRKEDFVCNGARAGGLRRRILKRMPVPLLQAAGTVLYKHMG